MQIFFDNSQQSVKYTAQIAIHQVEIRREGGSTEQKQLFITYLHTDYFSHDISSGYGRNIERENIVQEKCTFCGGANHSAEKNLNDKKGYGKSSCGR